MSLIFAHPARPAGAQDVGGGSNLGDLELEESFLPDPRSVSVTSVVVV